MIIFMCKPTWFDNEKAGIQYNALTYELHKEGVIIKYISDVDSVANAGVFVGPNTFLMSSESLLKDFFKRTYNILVTNHKFEGSRDVLYSHNEKILWLAHGFRTDVKVASDIGFPNLKTLELVDPRFYHLDTCFCPFLKDCVMLYVPAFSEDSFNKIKKEFGDRIIQVCEEDALNFACNSLYIPTTSTLIGHKYSASLKQQLWSLKISTTECNMSALSKSVKSFALL